MLKRRSGGTLTRYLDSIGVARLAPATTPFDPGVAPAVLESHLEQSAHLMLSLKVSMACWMIADEDASRRKLRAAREAGVHAVAGGGPYEVAVAQGRLEAYLDLCADMGFHRIECGEGFTDPPVSPAELIAMAEERGLEVEFELGKKHEGAFTDQMVEELVDQGRRWLHAGAKQLIVEARESAAGVGVFSSDGAFKPAAAERFAEAFGLERLLYEAPTKHSQFTLLSHFGPEVRLGNVPLAELLRVEIYRRGIHSDAFGEERLRPRAPAGKDAP
jgi:phosphosulfolactate synthase